MANAYLIDPQLPDQLPKTDPELPDQLPSDLWKKVLRHTEANVAVDWTLPMGYKIYLQEYEDPFEPPDLHGWADVRLCYEFKLERRTPTDGPVLSALFTRCVCPVFKSENEGWRNLTVEQRTAVENHFARSATIEPFLELRVQFIWYGCSRFAQFFFIRRDGRDKSPDWSKICRRELFRVLDELTTKLHTTVHDLEGLWLFRVRDSRDVAVKCGCEMWL